MGALITTGRSKQLSGTPESESHVEARRRSVARERIGGQVSFGVSVLSEVVDADGFTLRRRAMTG
jgi:hypothetical protein